MSEYKRQIAAGTTVAVVFVFVLALGIGALFPEASTTSTTSGTTTGTLTVSSAPQTSSISSLSISSSGSSSAVTTSATITSSATSTSTTSFTSTTTIATTTTATVTNVPTVCYTCGILNIRSANLTVSATGNRTVLSLTMVNNGSENLSNISVSIGFSPTLVVIPALSAGEQVWVSIQVSSSQSIKAGQSYQVVIAGEYGSYTTGAIATVEASSS